MSSKVQEQKIAVVTGGNRGIGRSIALNAAKRGVAIILTYNNNAEQANTVVKEISDAGGKAMAIKLNTADVKSFGEFAIEVSKASNKLVSKGRIDYLVNNAGIAQRSLIKDTTEEIFDELIAVNFKGVFFLIKTLLPLIEDGGQIVNISSALARFTFPGVAVYGSLKAGLETLTRYFAKELTERKIRANIVAPGAIDTEFGGGKGDEAHRQQIASVTSLGRLGVADDIGMFVAGMLSEDTRYMNAQRIEISGGMFI